MNDNLIAIFGGSNDFGSFSGKLVFDSRKKMPTHKEIIMIIKKYINIKGLKVTIIDPPLDINGKYTGNYFDFIFESDKKQKIKVFYQNIDLLEDFKKNPFVVWKTEPLLQKNKGIE